MQKLALYLWKNTMPGIGTKFTIWDRLGISKDGNKILMAEAPSSIQVEAIEALGVKATGVSVRFEGDLVSSESSIDYKYTITYSRTGSPPQWAPPLYLSRLTYYNLDNLHRPLLT